MSAFGTEVRRHLAALGKDASWLSHQTGISNSTISNWFSKKEVQPKPATVAKVEHALGLQLGTLAAVAGYTIRYSKDDGERARRRVAIVEARPRLGKTIDQMERLSDHDEDVLLSMMEAFIQSRLPPPEAPEAE